MHARPNSKIKGWGSAIRAVSVGDDDSRFRRPRFAVTLHVSYECIVCDVVLEFGRHHGGAIYICTVTCMGAPQGSSWRGSAGASDYRSIVADTCK